MDSFDKGNSYNEAEVLVEVANGNERAFGLLIEQYSAKIYAHVLAYLKKPVLAEEITQDIFLGVWKHRMELPAIDNFKGYLYVMTRNSTHTAFHKIIAHETIPEDDLLATQLLDPESALEYRELSATIMKGIDLLPPRRQEVFKLSRFEGLSYEQIAERLAISKSAVNQHIVEAIGFLRTFLSKESGLFVCAVFTSLVLNK